MKREDDQQLWDLLGRAQRVEVSPFFARNIVRKIRERPKWFDRLPIWLTPGRLAPVAGLAIAIIAAVLALHQPASQHAAESAPDVIANIDPQDYDVVADLDELLTTDENNLWDDDDTQTL
jgi:DNA primase